MSKTRLIWTKSMGPWFVGVALMRVPRRIHVGSYAELASRWHRRGLATSAPARVALGNGLAGVRGSGEGRGWYQKGERNALSPALTLDASGRGGMVGGELEKRRRW